MKISAILQDWYLINQRDLPWRHTTDAYRIWLSEIILQQTRVAQGMDYYLRFIDAFPTVTHLAQASEDEVLKLWQGLGYYSRARNLHKAARQVCAACHEEGKDEVQFPGTYAQLLALPGIGAYTAAAIASFASNEAVAAVDGNVYRVLARLFDIDTPIDSTQGQKLFAALALQELDPHHAARHNQAIMEFGALHCTPTSPRCADCPLADLCLARERHTQALRPVKSGRLKVRARSIHYYIYISGDRLWVRQRGAGDIWQGLWEYSTTPPPGLQAAPAFSIRHKLTHQTLDIDFTVIEKSDAFTPADSEAISWEEWQKKAVPKPIFEANRKISSLF